MPHVPWRAAAPGGRRGYQPGTDNAANRYYSVQSWPTRRVQRCGYKEVLTLLSIFVYAAIHDRRICSPRYHYLLFAPSSSSSFYACSPLSSRNTEESSLAAGYHLSRPAIHFVRSMKTAGLLLFLPKVYKEIFFFLFRLSALPKQSQTKRLTTGRRHQQIKEPFFHSHTAILTSFAEDQTILVASLLALFFERANFFCESL